MDIGAILAIRYLPDRPQPLASLYRDFLGDAVYAEAAGFDFVWTSEHHFAPDAWSPAQLPILGFLAARTERVRLGTNLFLLPFHNPLRVAEDAATVDILSGGRLDLAVGSGSIADEFETFGLDHRQRWGRMFEGLEVIRRSFSEDRFDHEGRHFHFPNVRMTTKPVQQPFPLWVGGFGVKTLRRAGREGYHLQGGTPESLQAYLQGLREGGHDPDLRHHQLFVSGHLARSTEQAWDEALEGIYHLNRFYAERDWIAVPGFQPAPPTKEEVRANSGPMRAAVGSPDDVLRQLEPMLKDSRVTHFGFAFRHAGMPTDAVRRSIDLFVAEVMPELRRWGRAPSGAPAAAPPAPSPP